MGVGDEQQAVKQAVTGGLRLLAQAVVEMFRSENGGDWQQVGGPSMLVYCANSSGAQWVKVVQLSDGATLLNEELYEGFDRTFRSDGRAAQAAFHTMEFAGWVGGFCFARDTEAQQFANAVLASCPKGTAGPAGPPPAPARPAPLPSPAVLPSSPPRGPAAAPPAPHFGWDETNGFSVRNLRGGVLNLNPKPKPKPNPNPDPNPNPRQLVPSDFKWGAAAPFATASHPIGAQHARVWARVRVRDEGKGVRG